MHRDHPNEERPFLMKLTIKITRSKHVRNPSDSSEAACSPKNGNGIGSLQFDPHADVLRLIGGEEVDRITALTFGPYDNGYILTGM